MEEFKNYVSLLLDSMGIPDYSIDCSDTTVRLLVKKNLIDIVLIDRKGTIYGTDVSKTWNIVSSDNTSHTIRNPVDVYVNYTLVLVEDINLVKLKINNRRVRVLQIPDFEDNLFKLMVKILGKKAFKGKAELDKQKEINKALIEALRNKNIVIDTQERVITKSTNYYPLFFLIQVVYQIVSVYIVFSYEYFIPQLFILVISNFLVSLVVAVVNWDSFILSCFFITWAIMWILYALIDHQSAMEVYSIVGEMLSTVFRRYSIK